TMTTIPTDGTVETSEALTQDQAADTIFARMTAEPDAPADAAGDNAGFGNAGGAAADDDDGDESAADNETAGERPAAGDDAEV
ncbi:hypothetical protein ACE4Z5_27700, partial [Salmonella enterica]|uniref:hypothetical protein n=1 Tax=Salmonella enterica TaxID=28901 RepID=UPI003D29A158